MHEIMLQSEKINNQNYILDNEICEEAQLKNQNDSGDSTQYNQAIDSLSQASQII